MYRITFSRRRRWMWIWTEARFWVRPSSKTEAFLLGFRAYALLKSMHLTKIKSRFRWLRASRICTCHRRNRTERCTTLPQSGTSSLKCLARCLVPVNRSSMIICKKYHNKSQRNKADLTKTATSRSLGLQRPRVGERWGTNSPRTRVKCRLRRGASGRTTFSISMRHRPKTT